MYIKSNSRFCINEFQHPKTPIPPNVYRGFKHLAHLRKMAQTRFDDFDLSTICHQTMLPWDTEAPQGSEQTTPQKE